MLARIKIDNDSMIHLINHNIVRVDVIVDET